jgi:3-hydroxyacyl-[acyl-carrier-protein] dehydratase
MRYLMIDRVERIERGRRLTAVKNVSLSEDYFREHFIGSPVMPGALLIESLAQAATALLEISREHRDRRACQQRVAYGTSCSWR